MALGYTFYRDTLVTVVLLGVPGPFVLWEFFSGKRLQDEPVVVYAFIGLVMVIWIAAVTVLTIAMVQARKGQQKPQRQ